MTNVWNVTKHCLTASMLAAVAVAALACNNTPADMAKDMAPAGSCCGKPGDPGNAEGVGKYCTTMADCTAPNTLCSAVAAAAKHTFFCTKPCNGDGGATSTECGSGATCTYDPSFGASGCVPNSCLSNLPPGCTL